MNEFPDAPDAARRMILKGAVAGGLVGLGFGGFPMPGLRRCRRQGVAGGRLQAEERGRRAQGAVRQDRATASDKINLDAPEIAENGAVVPIAVSSTLPKVTGIAILVLENPNMLAAAYKIPDGTQASVANRLKMAKTSKVVAVVESDGKLYSASKEVKVTVGGCGG